MKKAIGYIRISTKDQSVYSLPGQRSEIENYCHKNEIELLSIFEENGQSAKNFDRINWMQLESYIQTNHREIDYLIVHKYDRFSRNLTEALAMIDKIEKKYKIIILSILENIGVHPKSPMFFLFRTQLLLNANNELNTPIADSWAMYSENLQRLTDITYIFNSGDMHNKKAFINVVFDNKLRYQEGTYRTLYLNPIYQPKAALLKEKGLLIYEQSLSKSINFSLSAPSEYTIEPLIKILKWVASVKAA